MLERVLILGDVLVLQNGKETDVKHVRHNYKNKAIMNYIIPVYTSYI